MSAEFATEAKPYKECSTAPKSQLTATVVFDKDELYNLIDFIEIEFIDSIRRDEEVDNIDYIISMMNALQKLRCAHNSLKKEETTNDQCMAFALDCAAVCLCRLRSMRAALSQR